MGNQLRSTPGVLVLGLLLAFPQVRVSANPEPVSAGAVAKPTAPAGGRVVFGRLAINGDKAITVNGNSVRTGATVVSGAQLETPPEAGASLQLWPLGRVELAPRTSLQINFGQLKPGANRIEVNLLSGCAILMTYAGVEGEVRTPQGTTERAGPNARDFIDVCTGEPGAAAPVVDQGAAAKSGASGGWIVEAAQPQASGGFSPFFLLGASPSILLAGMYVMHCNGRPPVASPCGGCCCCC